MNIAIFCYGTLQQDMANARYCNGCLSVETATICGDIYQLTAGYPAVKIPAESILALGSRNPEKDALIQTEQNSKPIDFKIRDGWSEVHGELVTFGNPEAIIPIDRLEGMPHYYLRVLVPVLKGDGEVTTAWAYVMQKLPPGAKQIKSGRWRPRLR